MAATARKAPPTVQRDMEVVLAASTALKEQLKELLGGEENVDAITLRDTIEGETDLFEVLGKVALQIAEDETRMEGIGKIKRTADTRKQRLENRAELLRGLLLSTLDLLGEKKIELPIATISATALAPKLIVTDEPAIRSDFWKSPDPVLDHSELGDYLKQRKALLDEIAQKVTAGTLTSEAAETERAAVDQSHPAIEGAELSNGGASVQIRFA